MKSSADSCNVGISFKRVSVFAVMVFAMALTAGCLGQMEKRNKPKELGYEPYVLSVQGAREQAKNLSSQILDLMGIQGEVTEPGPGISTCSADPEKRRLYTVHHPWAVYGVSNKALERGMDGLRRKLPENGWKIVRDGRENSEARQPVIYAEHEEYRYTLDVSWYQEREKPQISVTLVSACLKTPEGESPSGQY